MSFNDPESEAAEVQRKMADVRREMDEDVEVLVESARSLIDWRGYVSSHPVAAIGTACAIGYALIPKKKNAIQDAAQLSGMLDGGKVVLARRRDLKPKTSLLTTILATVASAAMRSATAKVSQHFTSTISSKLHENVQDDNYVSEFHER